MAWTPAEQLLADLVEIPSVTADREANDRALDYIETHAAQLGMHTQRLSYVEAIGDRPAQPYGALVATSRPTKTPKVMISAHVDVVPVPSGADMFRLKEEDGRLLGRGVSDMKEVIAAALQVVKDLGDDLSNYDFGLTVVTNEEIGGHGVKNTLDDGFLPEVVILPDNGTHWQIEKGSKGAWTVVLHAPGKTAHGSRPWLGDSATFRLLDCLAGIRKLFEDQGPQTSTLNISELSGGHAQNQVPESAQATLDIRVLDDRDYDRIRTQVAKICKRHGVEISLKAFFAPLARDMNNPYIRKFRRLVGAVTGEESVESISPGACDAVYYEERGIPTIVCRPPGGCEHGDDEWIDRQGFQDLITILERFIQKTCQIR
jgi:succinyl-diaminopimelate desuccinylase